MLFLLACSGSVPGPSDTRADDTAPAHDTGTSDERAVASGVWSFDSLAFEASDADLAPLADITDGATLIGFGESIHYSGGYAQARARAIRYAVEALGYRAIGVEAPWFAAETTRAYVVGEHDDLGAAVAGLTFGTWASASTGELLTFVRGWNEAHPDDTVEVFGFDIQGVWDDFPFLREVVTTVTPDEAAVLWEGVAGCAGGTYTSSADFTAGDFAYGLYTADGTVYSKERLTTCLAGIDGLDAWVSAHSADIAAAFDTDHVTRVQAAARSVRAIQLELRDPFSVEGYDARDAGMADLVALFHAERLNGRPTVLWAHNAHLRANSDDAEVQPSGWVTMGTHLGDTFGDAYAPVALVAKRVDYDWNGSGVQTVRAGADSLEGALGDLGPDLLLVDARTADLTQATTHYGAPDTATGVPADGFRGFMWLRESETFEVFE